MNNLFLSLQNSSNNSGNLTLEGILILIIALLVYTSFTKPETIKIWVGYIYYVLAIPFTGLRKKAIKNQLEGPCTKALKRVSSEVPDLEIPDLTIKWVREDNLDTLLKSGKAIVKLKFSNDNTRNILKATSVYVRDAFLIHTKPYLHDDLKTALDFSITKKILINIRKNQKNIVSKFIQENIKNSVSVSAQCDLIEEIDDAGLFTRILLRELDDFGNKLFGRNPKTEHMDEASDLLTFIYDISTRDPDDNTPLAFQGPTLKVAVLLVAKVETYYSYGLSPYIRRIKLGLAKDIDSFYLLARDDKVEILDIVAKELLATGNFILVNNPREFRDSKNRKIICYCLRVNKDSIIANSIQKIGDSIKNKKNVEGVITTVRKEYIKVDIDGVEGIVRNHNMSILPIEDAKVLFKENSYLELLPLEIQKDGIVELTLINTKSDPNNYIKSNFEIGKILDGTVTYVDDEFIKVDIGDQKIQGVSFRKDLTFSRFIFLHEKFTIGNTYKFVVLGYEFDKGCVRLKLENLHDSWESLPFRKGQSVNFLVCRKGPNSLVGELQEGVIGILPYQELGWYESDILKQKGLIKLNAQINCKIIEIRKENRSILLSLKTEQNNPYLIYYKNYNGEQIGFIVEEITAYGIYGSLENKYKIYIPNYEISWDGNKFSYKLGKKYDVVIKDYDKKGNKFIGTFKPFIKNPLEHFSLKYVEGQVLSRLELKRCYEWGAVFNIKYKNDTHEGVLFKGDISNLIFIEDCHMLFNNIKNFPVVIRKIDKEKNRILLSLKELTTMNIDRISSLNYEDTYEGIILGRKKDYSVLLKNIWIEVVLESSKIYNCGDSIMVRPTLIQENTAIMTDE